MTINIQNLISAIPTLLYTRKDMTNAMPLTRDLALAALQDAALGYYYTGSGRLTESFEGFIQRNLPTGKAHNTGNSLVIPTMNMSATHFNCRWDPVRVYNAIKEHAPEFAPNVIGMALGADSAQFFCMALVDGLVDFEPCEMPMLERHQYMWDILRCIRATYHAGDFRKMWRGQCKDKSYSWKHFSHGVNLYTKLNDAVNRLENAGYSNTCLKNCVSMVIEKRHSRLVIDFTAINPAKGMELPECGGSESAYFNEYVDTYHDKMYIQTTPTTFYGSKEVGIKYDLSALAVRVSNDVSHLDIRRKVMKTFQSTNVYPKISPHAFVDETRAILERKPEEFELRYKAMLELAIKF